MPCLRFVRRFVFALSILVVFTACDEPRAASSTSEVARQEEPTTAVQEAEEEVSPTTTSVAAEIAVETEEAEAEEAVQTEAAEAQALQARLLEVARRLSVEEDREPDDFDIGRRSVRVVDLEDMYSMGDSIRMTLSGPTVPASRLFAGWGRGSYLTPVVVFGADRNHVYTIGEDARVFALGTNQGGVEMRARAEARFLHLCPDQDESCFFIGRPVEDRGAPGGWLVTQSELPQRRCTGELIENIARGEGVVQKRFPSSCHEVHVNGGFSFSFPYDIENEDNIGAYRMHFRSSEQGALRYVFVEIPTGGQFLLASHRANGSRLSGTRYVVQSAAPGLIPHTGEYYEEEHFGVAILPDATPVLTVHKGPVIYPPRGRGRALEWHESVPEITHGDEGDVDIENHPGNWYWHRVEGETLRPL